MEEIAALPVDPARARVHEHGWQSWSPTTTYAVTERPYRPTTETRRVLCYRPERRQPDDAFQGEGLLAVDAGDGDAVHVFAAPDGRTAVPSIRAAVRGNRVVVSADGPVEHRIDEGMAGIDGALARWADDFASAAGAEAPPPAPTTWCSWYHYFTRVTEADMVENLSAMDDLKLPIDVVQLDDGYQTEIGDWLSLSERFTALPDLVNRIRDRGRRAGLWVAPFLVAAGAELAVEHPDWLVREADQPVSAGHNCEQDLYALDTTHPGAAEYLTEVFATFYGLGIDFFKIDFIYAGAIPGRRHADMDALEAYRRGVRIIREAIGPSYLLGCGAPMLPTVGLVDAMRVSPDTGPAHEPKDGDMSQPSSRAAAMTGVARGFQHGRFWVNDPDCLVVRPAIERREEWAAHVERFGGLRSSSDRLADLDDWGLQTTRRILAEEPPERFVDSYRAE